MVPKVQLEQTALKLFLSYVLERSQGRTVRLAMRPELADQWEVVRDAGKGLTAGIPGGLTVEPRTRRQLGGAWTVTARLEIDIKTTETKTGLGILEECSGGPNTGLSLQAVFARVIGWGQDPIPTHTSQN